MDPFLLWLGLAISTSISTVASNLIQKGVADPALEPATEKIKQIVQGGIKAVEKNDALVQAILAAFKDASGQEGKALAMQYAQMIHLHEIVEPGKTAPRNAVTSISKKVSLE